MIDLIHNVKSKRNNLTIRGKLKGLSAPSSLYEHIKKSMPMQVENYKIISSFTHGKFSISDILDNLVEDPNLYFVNSRDTGLDNLLKEDGKVVFLDKQSYPLSNDELGYDQKNLLQNILSASTNEFSKHFINASKIYALSLRMDESRIDERCNIFLDLVKKNLPIRVKEWANELYFTTNKISPTDAAIIFRNSSGKIELGNTKEKKPSMWSRLTSSPHYGNYDIIFNIDNPSTQRLISLSTYGSDYSKNIAMGSIISQILEKFPLKSPLKQQTYRPYGGNNQYYNNFNGTVRR